MSYTLRESGIQTFIDMFKLYYFYKDSSYLCQGMEFVKEFNKNNL
ncbi:hypothetical protein JCM19314_1512 [Nonlabens ulvanivorans]|uniref:Uncharacterized protein n=1 Tax=Nonlabens ulvanivorans TaxID=906888 RepID=A0A081D933_NONUL|nr:hypothetical protein JCM19296_1021 [Nonlabens ulvanivorans]GAL01792.1 hypothetical protein JCM19314_1512 [Nonlabens ulvanivorans]